MYQPRMIHIIDPGLVNTGGHYYTQDLLLSKEVVARGSLVKVYTNEGFNDTLEHIEFQKIFRFDVYAECSDIHQKYGAFQNFFLVNRVFFADLQKIETNSFSRDDLVYISSITQNQLDAVGDWICTIPFQSRPALAITLRFLNSKMQYNILRGLSQDIEFLYQCATGKIKDRHPRTWFFSDTPELAEIYSGIINEKVFPLSVPELDYQDDYTPSFLLPNQNLNILYIGTISAYRGYELLPEIISTILLKYPKVTFSVQINAKPDSDVARLISNIQPHLRDRVQYLYGVLTREQYIKHIENSHIVLLPYMAEYYEHGASGVFCEAVSLGKVVCTTDGTTMAGDIRRFNLGATLVSTYSAFSFSTALEQTITNYKTLEMRQHANFRAFSRHHSPQGFFNKMFTIIVKQ